jgi:plasmid stabilization system protein ParE
MCCSTQPNPLGEFPERGRKIGRAPVREIVARGGASHYLIQYRIYRTQVIISRIRHHREQR